MFDCNSSSSSVRNEGVTCACLSGQSLKRSVSKRKKTGTKEREGITSSTRAGYVAPSFLTDDEEELQSNIDLVSLV